MPSISASLKFTQGALVGAAGQALFVERGSAVTCANANDANVQVWKYDLVEVPQGSALVPGTLSNGPTPTAQFTPDADDGYLLRLETQRLVRGKLVRAVDFRVAAVLRPGSGIFVPPFRAPRGALNFGGQTKGWQPYYRELADLVTLATGKGTYVTGLSSGNKDVTVYQVPASPAGNARFICTGIFVRVETAMVGAGSYALTIGATAGGAEYLTSQTINAATAVGTAYGLDTAQLGTAFAVSGYTFNALLNAADPFVVRLAATGTITTPVKILVRVHGTPT